MNRSQSLIGRLMWRVALLSGIAAGTIILAVITGISVALLENYRVIQNSAHTVSHNMDQALIFIEGDVRAVAAALPYVEDHDIMLRELLARNDEILQVVYVSPGGDILAQRRRLGGDVTFATDYDQFISSQKENNILWSDLNTSSAEFPHIFLAVDSYVEDIQSGTLIAQIDLTSFWEIIRQIQVGRTGYTYLVAETGELLAHRNLNRLISSSNITEITGRTPAEMAKNDRFIFRNLHRGLESRSTLSNVQNLTPVPWFIVAEQPLDDVLRALTPFIIMSILLVILVGILLYSILFFVRRRIVGPLLILIEGVREFRNGNMKHRIHFQAQLGDEIQMLGDTFNDMTNNIDQRTHDLLVANAKALESSRLKTEFLSTVSHELRTPLNAIMGYCGLMLEGIGGELDEEAMRMVGTIDRNSHRLLALIDDIIDVTRIEAGKVDLEMRPFSPQDLLNSWEQENRILTEQKGLRFKTEIDPNLPPLLIGDPNRLTQIAVNLLSNAIKFTDNGGEIVLEIQYHQKEWSIVVRDTGIGIPQHSVKYIFDKFRQLDSSTTREYGGMGLGLAIVQNLTILMGGRVKVQSNPGEGSTFTVTLPVIVLPKPGEEQFSLLTEDTPHSTKLE